MRIAILGTRGVPPRYGGFETFAAELSTRLVRRGHHVTVYSRDMPWPRMDSDDTSNNRPRISTWNGVQRIVLPAVRHKYLETVSHTFLSAVDALFRRFDVVLVCNAANAFVLPLLRAARLPVAINVDGIERHRRKWNVLGKTVYAVGETFSALFATRVIADADVIAGYYAERHGINPVTIRYGSEFPVQEDSDVLERLRLRANGYILYVSRFEPENNPLAVVHGYEELVRAWGPGAGDQESRGDLPPLVMVGDGLYAPELVDELKRHASERILFPGAIYGRDYRTLQQNALLYIQATEVGGTHPALIEAMAAGGCVLALDTPENREVGGGAIGYFLLKPTSTLSGTIWECIASDSLRDGMRVAARSRAAQRYSWNAVVDAYERLFSEMAYTLH